MVVELAAFPGTGKSTALRALVAQHTDWSSCIVPQSLWCAVTHPAATTGPLLRWVPPAFGWRGRSRALSIARRRVNQDVLARTTRAPLVFEEGITHHVWRGMFLDARIERDAWQPLVASTVPLIVLEIDDETLHRRISGKKHPGPVTSALAARGPASAEWRRGRELYEMIVREAERTRVVVRVPSVGDVDDSVIAMHAAFTAAANTRRLRSTQFSR